MKDKYILGKLCGRGHKYKNTKQSLRYKIGGRCVECAKISSKRFQEKNPKRYKQLLNRWKKTNPNYSAKWYSNNKEKVQAYYQNNREEIISKTRKKQIDNFDDFKKYQKQYRECNSTYFKNYRNQNREHLNILRQKRRKERYKTDPAYRLHQRIRTGLRASLQGRKKGTPSKNILGYTIQEAWEYFSWQLPEGTALSKNIHIHHRLDQSHFNFEWSSDEKLYQEVREYWKLSNLILLSKYDHENLHKILNLFPNNYHWSLNPWGFSLFGKLNI